MKKVIMTMQGEVRKNEPFVIVLPDKEEGDIKFSFRLVKEDKPKMTHTKFTSISEHEASITIYNAPLKTPTSVKVDIPVGTYLHKYRLYVNYTLICITENEGRILVKFYGEEE